MAYQPLLNEDNKADIADIKAQSEPVDSTEAIQREAIARKICSEAQKLSKGKKEAKDVKKYLEEKIQRTKTKIIEDDLNGAITLPEGKDNITFPKTWLAKAIQDLHVLDDQLNGINSQYITVKDDQGNDCQVLYRDGSTTGYTPQEAKDRDERANYTIMGLNYLDAAISLIKTKNENNAEQDYIDIQKKAKHFVSLMMQMGIKDHKKQADARARFLHQHVIPLITEKTGLSKSKAAEQLADILSFSNLDQANCPVATQFDVQGKSLLHIDIPMSGSINPDLKQELEKIRDFKHTLGTPWANLDIDWFDKLKPHVKDQICLHADDLISGRMISTRLLDTLTGARFAGEDRAYDLFPDQEEKDEKDQKHMEGESPTPKLISQGFHSGNPGHKNNNKEANLVATERTLGQLKTQAGKKNVVILSLTTLIRGFGFEYDIERQTADLLDRKGEDELKNIGYINLPLHGSRLFLSPIMDGAQKIFEIAENLLKIENKGPEFESDKAKLLFLRTRINEMLERIEQQQFSPTENDNLIIAAYINKMVQIINKYHDLTGEETFALIICCKSGKDRTAVQRLMDLINDIVDYSLPFGPSNQQDIDNLEKEVRRIVTRVSPPSKLAGMAGATLGAGGIIKSIDGSGPLRLTKDLSRATPIEWDDGNTSGLARKTTEDRHGLPPDPDSFIQRHKKLWKVLASIGVFLLGAGLCVTVVGIAVGLPVMVGSAAMISTGLGISFMGLSSLMSGAKGFWKTLAKAAVIAGGIVLCLTGVGIIPGAAMLAAVVPAIGQAVSAVVGAGLITNGIYDLRYKPTLGGKALGLAKVIGGAFLVVSGLGLLATVAGKVASLLTSTNVVNTVTATLSTWTATIATAATAAFVGLGIVFSGTKPRKKNVEMTKLVSTAKKGRQSDAQEGANNKEINKLLSKASLASDPVRNLAASHETPTVAAATSDTTATHKTSLWHDPSRNSSVFDSQEQQPEANTNANKTTPALTPAASSEDEHR